jgi:2-oxoglutarate ferredoxin oxidoreductase subunit delta
LKNKNIVIIDLEKCKGCRLCIEECKENIITISKKLNSKGYYPAIITDMDKCTGCTFCAISCPDGVIEVIRKEEE